MRISHFLQRAAVLVALGGTALLQAASTIQFSATSYTVAENAGTVTLIVQRTNDMDTVVSVDYTCTDGTAANGLKYTAVSGTLAFGAGETNKDIVVPILNEGAVEGTQTFTVSLSNPTGEAILGTRANATVRIVDNDKGLAFEFANYWAREDEGSVLIGVVRGDDGDFPVTVDVSTVDVTAQAGLDYTGVTNTLSFAAGEKIKLFTVPILKDGLKEANETFRLTLSNPTGGAVLGSPRTATVKIFDNDPGVQFTQNQLWVQEKEGSVLLTVTRGNDLLLEPFTVDYATANGTATAGIDYSETTATLTFAVGEMTRSFVVPILDDGVAKRDKQFKVLLSNPTGGMILGAAASATATVTVCDTREMLPHRFEAVRVSPDGTVSLTLGGGYTPGLGLSNRFQPYIDLYPLEVSSDLKSWSPLTWLVRTNASTNALTFTDASASSGQQRYYRVPAQCFIVPNSPPTGPYAVGRTDRWLTDPSRRNRFLVSTNSSFQLAIWYPATPRAGCWPLPAMDEPVLRDNTYVTGWVDRMPSFVGYAAGGLDLATSEASYPVVLLSPGWTAARQDMWNKADALASHGYIVVAPDHFDSSGVILPDGTYSSTYEGKDITEAGLRDRVRDLRFIVDQMEQWNVSDPLFAGRLDLGRIGSLGFSWGGAAAGEFCRSDARCRAAVGLDPGPFSTPELSQVGLQKPSLTIHRADYTDYTLFNKAVTDAVWFQVSNTQHQDIGGFGYFPSGTAAGARLGWEVNRNVNAYVVWFLNKYLKDSTDPMPALRDHPRVINFRQK